MSVALAFFALIIELMVGYPDRLVRAIGHPVIWIGKLINALDRALNRTPASWAVFARALAPFLALPRKRGRERSKATREGDSDCRVKPGNDEQCGTDSRIPGVFALLILLAAVGGIAFAVERALLLFPPGVGFLLVALAASCLLAQRSLYEHVARVAAALESGGVEAGRAAVSHIVGRDTAALDEAGVARAAIESLAENFSDGVVAPALWLAVGGLPGGALYKAANTADSMIGHRTPRYEKFGWAAARLDDLLNLPASRLSALLLAAAAALEHFPAKWEPVRRRKCDHSRIIGANSDSLGSKFAVTPAASAADAWEAIRRDAPRHRSPNAGYPEAAMAGALGLKLAGPRVYDGVPVDDAFMGDGRRDAAAADIRAALALYRRADALLIAIIGAFAAALIALA